VIYDFNLAYPYIFIFLVLVLLIAAGYRWWFWRPIRYQNALCSYLIKSANLSSKHFSQYLFYIVRLLALFLLALSLARPQGFDPKSKIKTEGVDIVLVLDVSNSMLMFDDLTQRQPRIEVAKKEAINFINKRDNDPIGLVLFGRYAVSRCPLTLDKEVLRTIITKTQIGEIDPNGTVLAIAMMTAINRLKYAQAKSRVMIVLTDGQPSADDIDPGIVIEIAKKLDIKIYTIGIGSEQGGFFEHPFFGVMKHGEVFNHALLAEVAAQTGGQMFQAKDGNDMRQIYEKIDQLERTAYQSDLFTKKYEYFGFLIKIIIGLFLVEWLCAYFVWFGI
jgi:Ca-activated chloride channel family protein